MFDTDTDTMKIKIFDTDTEKSILIRFLNRRQRDAFKKTAKARRLTRESIGQTGGSGIYIYDHLSFHSKKILAAAQEAKVKSGWKFVWFDTDRVLARKEENSKICVIRSLEDIAQIK